MTDEKHPVDVTSEQAAELLNVSHPYLASLLESGEIPYQSVGRSVRIRYQDILDYKNLRNERRKETLDELVAQAQELNMGY